jgi:hypothetical protein
VEVTVLGDDRDEASTVRFVVAEGYPVTSERAGT